MMRRRASFLFRSFAIGTLLVTLAMTSASRAFTQTAQFQGTVLTDDAKEKPLANAEILFPALNRMVRSDSLGNFLVSDLPFGKHAIVIRLVGYESINTEITLTTAKPPGVDLMLKPVTTKLATVETKATATPGPWAIKLQDFEERRKMQTGKFLTSDFFEKNEGVAPSAILLQKIAGLKFVQSNGRRWLASLRGCGWNCPSQPQPPYYNKPSSSMEKVPSACYMQVVVNGLLRYSGQEQEAMFDIDELQTKDIIGLEFYTTANTPLQYKGSARAAACGTMIIWTKGG